MLVTKYRFVEVFIGTGIKFSNAKCDWKNQSYFGVFIR